MSRIEEKILACNIIASKKAAEAFTHIEQAKECLRIAHDMSAIADLLSEKKLTPRKIEQITNRKSAIRLWTFLRALPGTPEEIAHKTGMDLRAVRQRLHRLRRAGGVSKNSDGIFTCKIDIINEMKDSE